MTAREGIPREPDGPATPQRPREPAAPAGGEPSPAQARLEELREEIEAIDRELIRLIARRVEVARRGGRLKERTGLPALDPVREAAVIRRAGALAREAGIDDEEVRDIFWRVIGLCRLVQGGAGARNGPATPASGAPFASGSSGGTP